MKNKLVICLIFSIVSILSLSIKSIIAKSDFIDMATIKPKDRRAQSPCLQFCYTSENNIGDYLPTLGMWKMLNHHTDLWSIKDKNIDFNFINKNYKYVIVGGAGILSKRSQPFYEQLLKKCKLPMIIWGVGICLPEGKTIIKEGIDYDIAQKLEQRCDLINVRDKLTFNFYKFKNAIIAPCPTVAYISKFAQFKANNPDMILYTAHEQLVPVKNNQEIMKILQKNTKKLVYCNHLFKANKHISEIDNIIKNYYCQSKIVVTTRLHGAIVAYALGIPYIAIPFDKKLISFYETYGNGTLAKNAQELEEKLNSLSWINMQPIRLNNVLSFGKLVKNWMK